MCWCAQDLGDHTTDWQRDTADRESHAVCGGSLYPSDAFGGTMADDSHQHERREGVHTMSNGMEGPDGGRVTRWMEDAPTVLEAVRRMLHEYNDAKEAARIAQAERERLQQHCEALREEIRQLNAEVKRLQRERAEVGQWFAVMMREVAARFPITSPPA